MSATDTDRHCPVPSRVRRPRRGATAVEFAIVAPIAFGLIFAVFEFSWLNVVRHTVDNAAYEANRIAIVPGATAAEAVAEAERILATVGVRDAVVTVSPGTIVDTTDVVTVSIDVPVDSNTLSLAAFTAGRNVASHSTLATERDRGRTDDVAAAVTGAVITLPAEPGDVGSTASGESPWWAPPTVTNDPPAKEKDRDPGTKTGDKSPGDGGGSDKNKSPGEGDKGGKDKDGKSTGESGGKKDGDPGDGGSSKTGGDKNKNGSASNTPNTPNDSTVDPSTKAGPDPSAKNKNNGKGTPKKSSPKTPKPPKKSEPKKAKEPKKSTPKKKTTNKDKNKNANKNADKNKKKSNEKPKASKPPQNKNGSGKQPPGSNGLNDD
ncbi:MAG: TadE/TadG family type IV pilus assembly protein [Planctomycetota bacterium]